MAKYNIGDELTYTNRQFGKDFFVRGKVIGFEYWNERNPVLEILENTGDPSHFYRGDQSLSSSKPYDSEKIRPGISSWERRTRSNIRSMGVPYGSRNLQKATKGYSPEQCGDTDEDI